MLSIRCGAITIRGILLALAGDAIRVALEDCGDVAEYRRVTTGWISEFGDTVEIDWVGPASKERIPFRLSDPHAGAARECVI